MVKTATASKKPQVQPQKPQQRQPEPEHQEEQPSRNVPAPRQSTQVATPQDQLPSFMHGDMDKGKETIGREDMDIPRLKLIQGVSKELQLYDELRPGHFFHTAAETIFDEPFKVVPIYLDKQYILWRPLEDGGGILARTRDTVHWEPPQGSFKVKLDRKDGGAEVIWKVADTVVKSGLDRWGTLNPNDPNSPPAATLMYNFLFAFPEHPDLPPAVLTFQRSSIKIGRKFMTKLRTVRTPLFGSIFTLSSYDDQNAANQDFKNINITGSGIINDENLYRMYKDLYEAMTHSGLNIRDIDTMQEDADAAAAEQPAGQPNY